MISINLFSGYIPLFITKFLGVDMMVRLLNTDTIFNNAYKIFLAVTFMAAALTQTPLVYAEAKANSTRSLNELLQPTSMVVYKSPTCGCCGDWVDHMSEAGFSAKIQHPKDLNTIKDQLGIAPVYQSCHTATLQDYLFEGHIPAEVVKHFLAEEPKNAIGLAVPGMPLGSPGMDFGGDNYRSYQVLQLNKDGSSSVYGEVSGDKKITYR
jgi:hypothetical protein